MSTYTHILVGLDLSEDSEAILHKAHTLGTTFGAKISIVHVIEPLIFAYGGDVPIDLSDAQRVMEEQARKRMREITEKYPLDQNDVDVVLGQTASELHNVAQAKAVDLIIVGSHGRHGLALLFGSTANGVLKGANCDVLAVRV